MDRRTLCAAVAAGAIIMTGAQTAQAVPDVGSRPGPVLVSTGQEADSAARRSPSGSARWATTYAGGWERFAAEHGIPTGGGSATAQSPASPASQQREADVSVVQRWRTTYEGGWLRFAEEHGIPTGVE